MRPKLESQSISSSGCGVIGDDAIALATLLEGTGSTLVRSGVEGVSSAWFSNLVGSEHEC